jgi:hypothetical protein
VLTIETDGVGERLKPVGVALVRVVEVGGLR